MKKHVGILFVASLFIVGVVKCMTPTYTSNLVSTAGQAYSTTFSANLNTLQVDELSFQAVYSSAVIANVNFNNGVVSTGSITVAVNSGFTQLIATNTITFGSTAALAATTAHDSVTVVSTTGLTGSILYANGRLLRAGNDWTISTATGTAESIKTILNSVPGIIATRISTVVTASATASGLAGNNYTMSSTTPTALSVASANFIGGAEQALTNAVLTVNGVAYRNGYLWKSGATSTTAATSVAAMLNNITGIKASSAGTVVYATATAAGAASNAFTMVSSTPTAMTIGSANFTNGRDSATVTINGVVLTYGTDWTAGASTIATATNISNAIVGNTPLSAIVTSTWTSGALVNITALAAGPNYSLDASPSASLTITGGHMTGGSGSAVDTTNDTITAASNGLTTAFGVLFSTLSASTAPGGLTNQTTYYAIIVDANTIKLASSSSNAQAGTAINITSQGSSAGTYRLAPLAITGTASFKWQESNDNVNWNDLNVSSVTFATPYSTASTFWDFGQTNMKYIRLNFVAPTTGGVALTVTPNGKRNP